MYREKGKTDNATNFIDITNNTEFKYLSLVPENGGVISVFEMVSRNNYYKDCNLKCIELALRDERRKKFCFLF